MTNSEKIKNYEKWFLLSLHQIIILFVLSFACFSSALANIASSTNFSLERATMTGGGTSVSSNNFHLSSVLGQSSPVGFISSTSFTLRAGYVPGKLVLAKDPDLDSDGDGYNDTVDAFPADNSEWLDSDGDNVGDNSDNCVIISNTDQLNTDEDSLGNICDIDDDNDGVLDDVDAFPLDATETADTDGDGVGNNSDSFPTDNTESIDTDGDGIGDNADMFPNNIAEWLDLDADGYGNNQDTDDDNDGMPDTFEILVGLDPFNASDKLIDSDGDGVINILEYYGGSDPSDDQSISNQSMSNDLDTDGDKIPDSLDQYPNNANAWTDSDFDGLPDSSDLDNDNDGYDDSLDAFPLDPNEWADTDRDNTGDNTDAFPNDSSETIDTDADGVGNNADTDDDNDGVLDSNDADPLDALVTNNSNDQPPVSDSSDGSVISIQLIFMFLMSYLVRFRGRRY